VKRDQEREEQERIEREFKERLAKELVEFKNLFFKAHLWKETIIFKDYIQNVEAACNSQ
jgi:hypothetical protein